MLIFGYLPDQEDKKLSQPVSETVPAAKRRVIALTQLSVLVKKRRQELGLTQRELGTRMGMNNQVVSSIETGYGTPTNAIIDRMAEALSLTASEMWAAYQAGPPNPTDGLPPTREECVRHFRIKSGLTRLAFARLAGIGENELERVEGGRRIMRNVPWDVFDEIFGLPIGTLAAMPSKAARL